MDQVRSKFAALRAEADAANERAEAAEKAQKELVEQQTEREQEIISLQNRVQLLEEEADRRDAQLAEAKQIQQDNAATLNQSDLVLKNATNQEEKIDALETQLREANKTINDLDLANEDLQRKLTQKEKDLEKAEVDYEALKEKYVELKTEFENAMKEFEDI
ncbi:tropomyosin-2 [Coemansia sp. Benny D115]|nr:tropomyosin-2 [Coemansia sp. Benny D115]